MNAIASLLSLMVSIVAIGMSIWVHRREHHLNGRMVALEEARERDRLRETAKAHLVADIQRNTGLGPAWTLQVENRGRAEARDIIVLLDKQPILNHPGVVRATQQGLNTDLHCLAAGASFRYIVAPGRPHTPPWELVLTWRDDSGEPGITKITLTL